MILETGPSHQIQIEICLQPPERGVWAGPSACTEPVVKSGVQIRSPFLLPPSFRSCGLAPGQCLTIMESSHLRVCHLSPSLSFFFNYDLQEGELR